VASIALGALVRPASRVLAIDSRNLDVEGVSAT
jgi:hypothetical protein